MSLYTAVFLIWCACAVALAIGIVVALRRIR